MNVGSLFSGVGGMDAGLAAAGHRHLFLCEADEYRRAVLAARFPGVPIYDDVRTVARGGTKRRSVDTEPGCRGTHPAATTELRPVCGREPDLAARQAAIDLLCGGFPCQDLSVAGRRAGLAGDRSGLFFEFARIAESLRPRWLLVENVPGLLSSQGGRDFGIVLGTLADLGYGLAWRILDSRFFGVPQRRRRVFIVGALADDDPRAAADRAGEVLAVGSRCQGHPPAGTQTGQDVAVASLSGLGSGGPDDNDGQGGRLVAETAYALNAKKGYHDGDADTNYVAHTPKSQRGNGGGGIGPEETLVAAPLTKGSATGDGVNQPGRRQEDDVNIVAFSWQQGDDSKWNPDGRGRSWITRAGDCAAGLSASGRHDAVAGETFGVRRLTPTECERLQALPDGWTQLGDTPDSRRYSALGDAVTASVAEWIGRRLTLVDARKAAA